MKRFLLAGAFSLAGAAALTAQTVTSINAVGYANVVVPSGFSMIANPLNTSANTLSALLGSVPAGTAVYKWTGSGFQQALHLGGGTWTSNLSLNPGEGVFILNGSGSTFTNTFVGEVVTGNLTNNLPTGFSIRSSQVPQAGPVQSALAFPAVSGDTIYTFDNATGYKQSLFLGGSTWVGAGEPNIKVGESFWVLKSGSPVDWTRAFSIN